MTVFSIDYKKNKLRAFNSEHAARNMGEVVIFRDAKELLENRNTTGRGLVEVYNNCVDKPVKKFTDNKTGAERIFKLAQEIHVESTPFDKVDAKQESSSTVEPASLTRPQIRKLSKIAKPRGKYEGKSIRCLVEKNPRREGTKGFHSMGILINSSIPVSYENYISEGGRPNDLAWDLEKGHVELV
jgi:hypothetical protein|tara:strand:+ start:25774 stop:26328 length:555 start_codon:yes stop_codon:yes gene_type:complete